jgi:hypothetical protein
VSELAKALAAFQAELPQIGKSSTANAGTYSYKYADLASVSAVALKLAAKHGLSFTARPTLDDSNRFVLAYSLLHASGDSLDGTYPLPSSGKPQEIGSAITYARRYCLCSVLGIAPDEDDDAQAVRDVVRPEPHEYAYDPDEQEQIREGYEAEIGVASAEELDEIAKRIASANKRKALSPNTFRRLAQAGAARRAELNGAEPMPAALKVADNPEPQPDAPAQPTTKALTRLHAMCGDLGIERADRLALMSRVCDREIRSSNDLTVPELDAVFAELDRLAAERKGAVTSG